MCLVEISCCMGKSHFWRGSLDLGTHPHLAQTFRGGLPPFVDTMCTMRIMRLMHLMHSYTPCTHAGSCQLQRIGPVCMRCLSGRDAGGPLTPGARCAVLSLSQMALIQTVWAQKWRFTKATLICILYRPGGQSHGSLKT